MESKVNELNTELSTLRQSAQEKASMREMKKEVEKSFQVMRSESQTQMTEMRFELEE